jgi:hypothetical protein
VGQFLPEVRGVFKLIELHKKDLKKALKAQAAKEDKRRTRSIK